MSSRGNTVVISGRPRPVSIGRAALASLYDRLEKGLGVDQAEVDAAIRMADGVVDAALAGLDDGQLNMVGLCHGIEHGWTQIAEVLGADRREEVEIICAGINHQTWYTHITHRGRGVSGAELLAAFEGHPVYSKTEKVRIDVLRRFGYYSTESNGHLSEYLPWYRKRPRQIRRWIDLSSWYSGETGG